ncbi:MAG: 4Fe-4S dicluster domain-containing protein, partial [Desulfurococcales archaeon]|nr:4Fe-4S dicluster domain-containing protein [Desulfurococcales archaeon]
MTLGTTPYIEHYVMVEDLKLVPYILGLASALVLVYALYEGYKRWTHGGQRIEWTPITARVSNLVKYALLQWKVLRHRFPGTMHLLIYAGMLWLFIATLLRALDLRIAEWTGSPLLAGLVFEVYKLLNNIAGVAVVVGSIIAIIRRAAGLTPNLPKDRSYYAVHIGFILIVVTGFLLDGMAAAASPARASAESPVWDPVGYAVYSWASGLSFEELRAFYRPLWVIHLFVAQLMLALIPFTNLWHIASASLNVALARREPPAMALKPVLDIDARVEEEKPIGIVKLSDTTWKQRLDYDACTSCMRCTNSCPAFATDKPLSPRDLIITLRDAMYAGKWDEEVVGKGEFKIQPDTVWSCVTCGACLHECPVLIHHVDTIIDLRRGLISTGSEEVPEDAQNALYNMMQQGNPFGFNPAERDEWLQSLAEKYGEDIIAQEGVEYDYLYWLGCVTSYDPRIRPVAEAVIELLR